MRSVAARSPAPRSANPRGSRALSLLSVLLDIGASYHARSTRQASARAKTKRAASSRPSRVGRAWGLVVHAAHAAAARHRRSALLLGSLGDHGLRGDEQAGDRRGVLERGAHHLGGIDDPGGEHVDVLFGLRVEAEGLRLVVGDPADHDRALDAGVLGDLADLSLKRFQHDVDAGLDVGVLTLKRFSRCFGTEQRNAAARDDTFLDRRAGGVKSVLDAVLLLLHLHLGRTADADDRDAARELRQTLLELLTVVVRGGLLDLRLDLGDAALDVVALAGTVDDRRVLFLDAHALRTPEHL